MRNRAALDALTELLLEREKISGEEVVQVRGMRGREGGREGGRRGGGGGEAGREEGREEGGEGGRREGGGRGEGAGRRKEMDGVSVAGA